MSTIDMEIRRFYINPNKFDGAVAVIDGDEFVHAVKVLRQKVGYKIVFCTGDGNDYLAEISKIEKDRLYARVLDKTKNTSEPKKQVILFQGAMKNKNDFIVQKAVELGVSKVVFFISKNVSEKDVSTERLNKIAIEACKQCGRAIQVDVQLMPFSDVVEQIDADTILFYEEERQNKIRQLDLSDCETLKIIIGSEGGFDISEVEQAKQKGAKILSLGARILRAETAAIVATAFAMDALGEM